MFFFIAKNLLKRLICSEDERLDVYQAMNHEFFAGEKTMILAPLSMENLSEEENESCRSHSNSLENNIKEFNK